MAARKRRIRTEAEYRAALARIEALAAEPLDSAAAADELDAWLTAVGAYERESGPDGDEDPPGGDRPPRSPTRQ